MADKAEEPISDTLPLFTCIAVYVGNCFAACTHQTNQVDDMHLKVQTPSQSVSNYEDH